MNEKGKIGKSDLLKCALVATLFVMTILSFPKPAVAGDCSPTPTQSCEIYCTQQCGCTWDWNEACHVDVYCPSGVLDSCYIPCLWALCVH